MRDILLGELIGRKKKESLMDLLYFSDASACTIGLEVVANSSERVVFIDILRI